jgi:hypothetical protein
VLQKFNRRAACLDPSFNRQQDPTIFPDEMKRFQSIAEPFVQRCIVR